MNALIIICPALLALAMLIYAYPKLKKAFSNKKPNTEARAIYEHLVNFMPCLCEGDLKVHGRAFNSGVSSSWATGNYDNQLFCFRVWVSTTSGEPIVFDIDKEDKNPLSIKVAERFREVKAIKKYNKDTFIKRLVRKVCGK